VQRPEVALAFVTGRHRALVEEAIAAFGLPQPDYVIGDVGTSIYSVAGGVWSPWSDWADDIAPDWVGREHADLAALFSDLSRLVLQEPAKQGRFKVSYYAPPDIDADALCASMDSRLRALGVQAALIWSIDETTQTGLLDVLPQRATKLHAVEFLMQHGGYAREDTVFCGDSGNDLPVLVSAVQAVLVANATDEVREQALTRAQQAGTRAALYLARGGFLGLNGNYSAGILEGVAHYRPELRSWLLKIQEVDNAE